MEKRGISPVIATVLLIAMVVVVALIIFVWFRGMVGESAIKMDKNVELVCDDVDFEADYVSDELSIVNGNVPIFRLRIKVFEDRSYGTEEIVHDPRDEDGWKKFGLLKGESFSGEIPDMDEYPDANKIIIYPTLLAEGDDGKKTYVCEGQYGKEIAI